MLTLSTFSGVGRKFGSRLRRFGYKYRNAKRTACAGRMSPPYCILMAGKQGCEASSRRVCMFPPVPPPSTCGGAGEPSPSIGPVAGTGPVASGCAPPVVEPIRGKFHISKFAGRTAAHVAGSSLSNSARCRRHVLCVGSFKVPQRSHCHRYRSPFSLPELWTSSIQWSAGAGTSPSQPSAGQAE